MEMVFWVGTRQEYISMTRGPKFERTVLIQVFKTFDTEQKYKYRL